jgi:16S rRNA (cytidine1402-2'-O)-methyltransferase
VTSKKKIAKTPSPLIGLQIVGTPIGNLEDITLRALRILRETDLIAAEDTRRTRKLLTHYDIHTPLVSYHEHNKQRLTPKLVEKLKNGKVVALVSDAGMPGISDPGHDLITRALEEEIPLSIVPGPSSITAALILSGLSTKSFQFAGFLPRKQGERSRRLRELLEGESTSIVFESPNRLAALLDLVASIAPERRIAVARELTKKFEEVVRTSASEAAAHFAEKTPRGEFVVVLEGAAGTAKTTPLPVPRDAADLVKDLMQNKALSKKDAMRKAAQQLNISRREVYRLVLEEEATKQ